MPSPCGVKNQKKVPSCFCQINMIRIVCMSESKGQRVFSYNQPSENSRHTAGSRFQQSPCIMWDWLSVEHRKAERNKLTGRSVCCLSVFNFSLPPLKPPFLPVQAPCGESARANQCSSNKFNKHNCPNKWWVLNNLILL